MNLLDAWRDEQVERACSSPGSGECQVWTAALQIAARSYDGQWGNAVDLAERSSVQQQAFKYQQASNNPFLHGVGTGLLKLSPPGLAVGAVGGVAALVQSVVDSGAAETLIGAINGVADFPAELKGRLNSDDPAVRGEALVDAVTLSLGGTAITAGGVRLTVNAAQKAALGRELAKAEAEAIAKARVEIAARVDDAQQYDRFTKADGTWDWPADRGFKAPPTPTVLEVGTILDRYGPPSGSFMSPLGVTYEERALAPGSRAEAYHKYEVVKPLPVIQGEVAPAFGQPGGGIQILPNLPNRVNVEWLIFNGYIKEVR